MAQNQLQEGQVPVPMPQQRMAQQPQVPHGPRDDARAVADMLQQRQGRAMPPQINLAARNGFRGQLAGSRLEALQRLGIAPNQLANEADIMQQQLNINPSFDPNSVLIRDQIEEYVGKNVAGGDKAKAFFSSFDPNKRSIYDGEVPDNYVYNRTQMVLRDRRRFDMYDQS